MVQGRGGGGGGRRRIDRTSETSNGKGCIEVFPDLCDYPMSNGPSVDPGDGTGGVAAFDEDGGSEGGD